MTAITALTAQNTVGVTGVHPVPGAFIVEQVRAVAGDIGVDAVKIGMLGTAEIVAAVDEALDLLGPGTPIVIDPVMVAESGAVLLDDAARARARRAAAAARDGDHAQPPRGPVLAATGAEDAEALARALHALGPDVVVVTGGHREEATDVLFDGERIHLIPGERHPDGAAHGSAARTPRPRRPPRARPRPARGRAGRQRDRGGGRSATACAGIGAGRRSGRRPRADRPPAPASGRRPARLGYSRRR